MILMTLKILMTLMTYPFFSSDVVESMVGAATVDFFLPIRLPIFPVIIENDPNEVDNESCLCVN